MRAPIRRERRGMVGHPGTPQAGTWVSLEPGYEVFTNADISELTVKYNGVTVQ